MEYIKLKDLCEKEERFVAPNDDTHIDYVDISSVDNKSKSLTKYDTYIFAEAPSRARKRVKHGDVIVSTVRPNLNAVARFNIQTPHTPIASTGFCVLRHKSDVDPIYIYFFCISPNFVRQMVAKATGASYPAVSDTIVREAKLPKHTAEKRVRIVSTLSKAKEIIEHRRAQLAKLDELVKCRFVELFGDPLSPRIKWHQSTFGREFEIFSGGTPSTGVAKYWDNGTIPWIGSNMCEDVVLTSTDGKYITEEGFNNSSAKWAHAGYVIVALVGATIGKTALLTISTTTNQNVASVNVPCNTSYTPEFVYMLMRFLYSKFMDLGNGGFKMANLGFIRQLPLPSPPTDLQREYSDFMRRIDKLRFVEKSHSLVNSSKTP